MTFIAPSGCRRTSYCVCGAQLPSTTADFVAFENDLQICHECLTPDLADIVRRINGLAATGADMPPAFSVGGPIDQTVCCIAVAPGEQDCREGIAPRRVEILHGPAFHGKARTSCPHCLAERWPVVDSELHNWAGTTPPAPRPAPAPVVKSHAQVAAERRKHLCQYLAGALSGGLSPMAAAERILDAIEQIVTNG